MIALGRALGCAALAGVLAACGATVSGHPRAARGGHVEGSLTRLLPGREQFPARYVPVVLSAERAARAAADLSGVADGARVEPADCAEPVPSFAPDRGAIEVGTDDTTRSTLTVQLTRSDGALAELRARLERCGAVRATRGSLTNMVVTQIVSAPSADADDTLALDRTVAGQVSGPGLTRTMRTLLGQVGDVRVAVTYLSYDDGPPDAAGLDQLFTAAVADVRNG
ncbi:sensor domain-containing protein [Nocardia sp. NPDC003482]